MNTPAHLILGAAAFGRPAATTLTVAAIVGSLLPDVSLYLLAGFALFIQQIPPSTVFGELYFSDPWQRVFAIDNSVFVWGAVAALGYWLNRQWLTVLGCAALLHLATDFPLHHDDGRPHFWPISDWVFSSPISYWDRSHYGGVVGTIEPGICLLLCYFLWLRFPTFRARALILCAAASELFVALS